MVPRDIKGKRTTDGIMDCEAVPRELLERNSNEPAESI